MFGWKGGWGWRRWMLAEVYRDPDRALFGRGPCGELMYRLYKEGKLKDARLPMNPLDCMELLKKYMEEKGE